jgi:hypothetical protein
MITLAYRLAPEWNTAASRIDLSTADELTLRYSAVLGDQVFAVDGADFSARWGWVPLLHFAASLSEAVRTLASGVEEGLIEFTESEASIRFRRRDELVRVTANYVPAVGTVLLKGLADAAEEYAQRLLREVSEVFPELRANKSLTSWYPASVPTR